jgi:hypothetical protein
MQTTFRLLILIFWVPVVVNTSAQKLSSDADQDTLATYFQEVKIATERNIKLWDINIYGPIMLVNPSTRQAYSNYADSLDTLRPLGKIFTGILPNNIVLGNATARWHGTNWAMILLPFLSKTNKADRINLLSHELFHRSQAALNFKFIEPNNNHLDHKEGRILLRFELEELKQALIAHRKSELNEHLANALTLRKYRYEIYPAADSSENWAELNEGLAEYSGIMMSGRNKKEIAMRFQQKIDELKTFGTFVRTFAYRTTPVYGFLLRERDMYWNKNIAAETNLTDYFIKAFHLQIKNNEGTFIERYKQQIFAGIIIEEETQREEKTKRQVALYKAQFVTRPHFEIAFEKKRLSFDSRNVTPVEGYGVVYPTLTASDNWGILEVDKVGGLLSPLRDKITISVPLHFGDQEISGEGWLLKLNGGYKVFKDEESGNYTLIKN